MAYKYTHFIPQNIAPKGTESIGVYDSNGNQVCTIPLGNLTPVAKEKLYSFGLISDIHLCDWLAEWNPIPKFEKALTYFEENNCVMCVITGDLTQTGFYLRTDEEDPATEYQTDLQFNEYKKVCDNHPNIPVYELMGNHESYYNRQISNNLAKLQTYTGKNVVSYTISNNETSERNEQLEAVENDLFILLGQTSHSAVMSGEDFEWFSETLEANKDKRCFVFIHPYMEEDSGDAMDVRDNSIFDYWGTEKTTKFVDLLKQYPNVILFHGHSHMKYEMQEFDKNANYTERNGFKSVHVSSLASPRHIDFDKLKSVNDFSASQGYIVDVYDDCIVLNGMDFINNQYIPLGVLKIDTT